mmetsp:Transcript_9470/g.17793  ORF Transcript_9470/g.17793 Transcript_9470/m.17793 type:complete len:235 (+) Transcript_9470:878-1582(+)
MRTASHVHTDLLGGWLDGHVVQNILLRKLIGLVHLKPSQILGFSEMMRARAPITKHRPLASLAGVIHPIDRLLCLPVVRLKESLAVECQATAHPIQPLGVHHFVSSLLQDPLRHHRQVIPGLVKVGLASHQAGATRMEDNHLRLASGRLLAKATGWSWSGWQPRWQWQEFAGSGSQEIRQSVAQEVVHPADSGQHVPRSEGKRTKALGCQHGDGALLGSNAEALWLGQLSLLTP